MIESKTSATPARRGTGINAAAILVLRTIPEGTPPVAFWMCRFCGDLAEEFGRPPAPVCRVCGATAVADRDRNAPTEIEQRDMQIEFLKRVVADGWDFQRMLLGQIICHETGDIPAWPAKWGGGDRRADGLSPAQACHRINFAKGRTGDEIQAVVRRWDRFGRFGE